MLVISQPGTEQPAIGLLVRRGIVTEAPPLQRNQWLGRHVNNVFADTWRDRRSITLTWLADPV
jgi:hypothetical protein